MDWWIVYILWVLITFVVFMIGYLYGIKHQKTSEKNELHFIGQLLVDTDDKSVYMSFMEDPQKLKNGELVSIQALVVESQQKQDS